MRYLHYLWYVVRHKFFVGACCWREGLIWRGLVHDVSKFLPSEFGPYANFFYGQKNSDIKKGRDETGYYKPTDTGDAAFDFAWLLHQKRNRHHWQFWILPEDDGGEKVLEMPLVYAIEMLCDWKGAGRAQRTPDTLAWYMKNGHRMRLHPRTRVFIEERLGVVPEGLK